MSSILEKTIAAAGGAVWKRPQTLQLQGQAQFTPFGRTEDAVILDTYKMYRVFPTQNQEARSANGKVYFEAAAGEELFFHLKFNGQDSVMEMGEQAKPYATHFKWSNNFGFGILRFADEEGFSIETLASDQIEGHPSHFIKITDPTDNDTFFAIDEAEHQIRMVGFTTEVGYHHRIYSDFERADNGFLQPKRVRIYFDQIKWMDIRWDHFEVNGQIADELFT